MDGARRKLLENLLDQIRPAAGAEGLIVEPEAGLPGFNPTTAALRDADGRLRLIVAVYGSDPAPVLNLAAQTPPPYLLTASSLTPTVDLRIPAQLGGGRAESLAAARLPGSPFTPETLALPVPAVTLDLARAYAGVLDLAPAPQRLRIEVELDLVSEATVDTDRLRRTVLHLVSGAWRQGLLNEAGEAIARLAVRVGPAEGPAVEPVVLTGR